MHQKLLIGNTEFYSDIASHARRSIDLATKLAMLLEEGNANLKELHRLRKALLEARDSFHSLSDLLLDPEFNIVVDKAYLENYIRSVYGIEPTDDHLNLLAGSVRRFCLFGFIGFDLHT